MNTLDEAQLQELVVKGEKAQAVKLIMGQTNMSLQKKMDYLDKYCLKEDLDMIPPGTSYSATNKNNIITYYKKTENSEKQIISKEEAPESLVNVMESRINRKPKEPIQQDSIPNYKKLRRILTYISIPLIIAITLFAIYHLFTRQAPTAIGIIVAFACVEIVFSIYVIELISWLIESNAKQQKEKADEMGIPDEFVVRGRMAKIAQLSFNFFIFAVWAIIIPYFSYVFFMNKNYLYGLLSVAFFVACVILIVPTDIRDLKAAQKSLHILGPTIHVYQGSKEIATIPAATAVIKILCFTRKGMQLQGPPQTYQFFGPRHKRVYPRAQISSADGTEIAVVFLSLLEYRLLKKYSIQQGTSFTDYYNHF